MTASDSQLAPATPTGGRPIAVLGVGRMGAPVAGRLAATGNRVWAWNRSPEKLAALAAGVETAPTPADAARGAELVIFFVRDEATVARLLEDGVAAALVPSAIVIEMTTSSPAAARRHAALLAERGIAYLDSPVSGGVEGAKAGTLSIMVGGEAADLERARPLLEPLGRCTHVGPVGSGQLAKAVNQTIVAGTIAAVAEGFALARASGANPQRIHEALLGGWADGPIFREHGRRMVAADFEPGATIENQLKDLRIIAAISAELGIELPLSERITALYEALAERGESGLDHSALIRAIERGEES